MVAVLPLRVLSPERSARPGFGVAPLSDFSSPPAAQDKRGDVERRGLVFAQKCEMMLKDMLRLIERDDVVRREGELAPMR
jgi:hypothetical protein